ncbi:carboxyltransferase domain-containing protein [Microbacterium sp. KUDC0406]|uniref:carboxyltransferase domain-containing protein n=1 Tax=Microbacterium sp. KUDC0406 TaxID=2909588 RepID=UPI001F2E823C|nr:carboxyltransferase domain-containing protein [Microbacterium sp. KUDC0406]UJP09256.1 carboxyltransferase domain-containing protein [Microbacterium sp. KUDC0406]
MRILTASDRALLVEAADLDEAMRLNLAWAGVPGVVELIPGARTVLVRFDPVLVDAASLAEVLSSTTVDAAHVPHVGEVAIPVRYDGEDLADVAALLDVSTDEVVSRHLAAQWQVAFSGFAPGFGYAVGSDPLFDVPRRSSPRTRVPAGSVALAGQFSGVYPRESPGGWQLIGRTDAVMWDIDRDPPALFAPGTLVRFERAEREIVEGASSAGETPSAAEASHGVSSAARSSPPLNDPDGRPSVVERAERDETPSVSPDGRPSVVERAERDETPSVSPGGRPLVVERAERDETSSVSPDGRSSVVERAERDETPSVSPGGRSSVVERAERDETPSPSPSGHDAEGGSLEVLRPALQLLVQDPGRPGHAALGVSASGAADRTAMRDANRAVGNATDAAVLELVGGASLRYHGVPTVAAIAGAVGEISLYAADGMGSGIRLGAPFALDDGDELRIGHPVRGLRYAIAVRGGIRTAPALGSAAADTLAGLGPAPLAAGDLIAVGDPRTAPHPVQPEPLTRDLPAPGETAELRILLGPRDDWFTDGALEALTGQEWDVTPRSDRVGIRLHGVTPLERAVAGELPSEGAVTGAIQVPPDGQPVLFLPDHPLTGGYPIIGAVIDADLDLAGQLPPGARVRFRVAQPVVERPTGGRETKRIGPPEGVSSRRSAPRSTTEEEGEGTPS